MAHIEMVVWVDETASTTTQSHLRTIWPDLEVFNDLDSCIFHITSNIESADAAVLIVSGIFGQKLAPVLDEIPQLHAVYVYCRDLIRHVEWAKHCTKIGLHRVFNQENNLIKQLTIELKGTEEKVYIILFVFTKSFKPNFLNYS